jgi:hypothetical protein
MRIINHQHLIQSLLSVFKLPVESKTIKLIEDAVWEDTGSRPYESTLDLLTLYASNLRNGGSPAGPRSDLFGQMTRAVVIRSGFIDDNRLIKFERKAFAKHAADHVKDHPLSHKGGSDNVSILNAIASGQDADFTSKLLYKLVSSIEQFAQYLIDKHDGSALKFSQQFLKTVVGNDPFSKAQSAHSFRSTLFNELNFTLMGPAITSNFMKDSQIGLARSHPDLFDTYLGALAKPDMHVMRMMLVITGRIKLVDADALKNLCFEQKFIQLYDQNSPVGSWPRYPKASYGEEKCLQDMNFLSYTQGFPTVFLDRILYLAGSGNSFYFENLPKVTQLERYQRFMTSLGLHLLP